MPLSENKNSGVSGGVTAVTSTVGNGVGGLLGTVGGVVGAAGRGGMLNSSPLLLFQILFPDPLLPLMRCRPTRPRCSLCTTMAVLISSQSETQSRVLRARTANPLVMR